MTRRETLTAVLAELRAMRPSTDVNRLSLSRQHREDELGKLAYGRAINDACGRINALDAALTAQEVAPDFGDVEPDPDAFGEMGRTYMTAQEGGGTGS